MSEAIGSLDVDYTTGFEEISSYEKPVVDPSDAKVTEISERTIGEYPTLSTKELTGWHPAAKSGRIETIAKGMGVQTAVKPAALFSKPAEIAIPAIPDGNDEFLIQSQIIRLSNESRRLKNEQADIRRMGRTVHIICAVVGFLFFIAGLIPGLLIGWAIRELAYNRRADRKEDQANQLDVEILQLSLLLRQQGPSFAPPRFSQPTAQVV